MKLNLKDAKRIILHGQGLLQTDQFGRGINAVQKTIEQLGYVQIDTISVVERAHHHTLRTRISNYSPKMLHKLVSDRQTVFEYWSHAAAFLPMQDYRFYQPVMKGFAKKRSIDQKVRQEVVRRIAAEGPLQSRDFENPRGRKSTGWWDWKPTKRAMEHMFLSGELMVRERRGFQKVYDLTENVLPDHIDVSWPTDQEQGHFYVRRMLSGLGIGTAKDIGYARPTVKRLSDNNIQPCIDQSLLEMTESGEITSVEPGTTVLHPHLIQCRPRSDVSGSVFFRLLITWSSTENGCLTFLVLTIRSNAMYRNQSEGLATSSYLYSMVMLWSGDWTVKP